MVLLPRCIVARTTYHSSIVVVVVVVVVVVATATATRSVAGWLVGLLTANSLCDGSVSCSGGVLFGRDSRGRTLPAVLVLDRKSCTCCFISTC